MHLRAVQRLYPDTVPELKSKLERKM